MKKMALEQSLDELSFMNWSLSKRNNTEFYNSQGKREVRVLIQQDPQILTAGKECSEHSSKTYSQ